MLSEKINIKERGFDWPLSIIGPAVFLSISIYLLVIRDLFSSQLILTTTHSGIIADATYAGVNVNGRVNIFYYRLFVFGLVFISALKLTSYLKIKVITTKEFKIFSFMTLLSSILLVPYFFAGKPLLPVLVLTFLIVATIVGFKKFKIVKTDEILSIVLATIVLLYMSRNLWLPFSFYYGHGYLIISLISLLLVFSLGWILLFSGFSKKLVRGGFLFIMTLPFISFISYEMFSMFYNRWSLIVKPFYLIPFWSLCVAVLYYCFGNYFSALTHRDFYDKHLYPLFVIAFSFILYYSFFLPHDKEMFELANQANALMRLFKFHEVPLFEAYSSHLISEQYYGILYNLINGYNGSLDYISFKFMNEVLIFIAWYYFLLWITGRGWVSVVLIFLYPYLGILIPGYYVLALLSPYLISQLYRKYTLLNFLKIVAWTVFLVFWRVDLGVANTIATGFLVLYFAFYKKDLKVIKQMSFVVLGVVLLFVTFFMILYFSVSFDLLSNIMQVIDYIRSNIAHGLYDVTYNKNRFYYLQYYVFPPIVVMIVLVMIYFFRDNLFRKEKLKYSIVLFFISFFYLFNAQRGIVRHSMTGGFDSFIASYIFLIVAFLIAFFLVKNIKVIWFVLTGTLVVILCRLTDVSNSVESHSDKWQARLGLWEENPLKLLTKGTRMSIDSAFAKENYLEIGKIMDSQFSDSSTFLDFSNTPMFYYYSQRQVPSVFNQYMQNTVTPFLQKENIKFLSSCDVPLVVYSNYPTMWWDITDGVENCLRYYHTSNYIFNNYKPLGIANKHYLWIKKNLSTDKYDLPIDSSFVFTGKHIEVRKLAWLLGNTKDEFVKKEFVVDHKNIKKVSDSIIVIQLPEKIKKLNGNWLIFEIENLEEGNSNMSVKLKSESDSFKEDVFAFESKWEKGKAWYLFPVSSFYKWHLYEGQKLELIFPPNKYKLISIGYSESL